MDIARVRQSMMKQAASATSTAKAKTVPGSYEPGRGFKSDSDYADHTKVYTDIPPGGSSAFIHAAGPANDKFRDAFWAGYNKWKDNRGGQGYEPNRIGATPYDVEFNTAGGNPVVNWQFNDYWYNPEKRQHTWRKDTTTYPNQTVSHRAGLWLMAPSYRQQRAGLYEPGQGFIPDTNRSGTYEPGLGFIPDANRSGRDNRAAIPASRFRKPDEQEMRDIEAATARGELSMTVQPFNNRELYTIETGDPTYSDKLMEHFNSIPWKNWYEANLRRSSPQERAAWWDYVPTLVDEGPGYYSPKTGAIEISNDEMKKRYNDIWRNIENKPMQWDKVLPEDTYGNHMTNPASLPGMWADIFLHENRHQGQMGQRQFGKKYGPNYPTSRQYNRTFDTDSPVSGSNIPALMRSRSLNPLFFTDKQMDMIKDHAIQPYALSEVEQNQALMALNAGRWALKRDMTNNPLNPNYAKISPEVRQQFMDLPDFITPGEEGRQQFDNMMQFFITNPGMKVLIPGGARVVGYYQNLKAAIDNAETPEEKQYFQNLMDKMIYSKSFLANNQQRPNIQSYADYKQMYA